LLTDRAPAFRQRLKHRWQVVTIEEDIEAIFRGVRSPNQRHQHAPKSKVSDF
jgi:hypothetical protein